MLESRPEEADQLFNDLLVGVTQFFRDPEAFEALARQVVPKLFEGQRKQRAGASLRCRLRVGRGGLFDGDPVL